ncbi:MAG TPA: c-type cytochrome [Bryobacteraceae bacterium]|nr:c-type cytochrome [Bryobacteraceae bacterium]
MMRLKNGFAAVALFGLSIIVANRAPAQETPQAAKPAAQTPSPQSAPAAPDAREASGAPGHRVGGFVPGQKRPPGDPAQIARGKTLFGVNCRSCHGADLRGGDMGGPNLLRSQVALRDLNGELIVPIIQGSRQQMGMPAIPISPDDAKAVAAYVRSVIETIGSQGKPPDEGRPAPSILVGNASEGKSYFEVKCASCHSATGDLQGIASKIPDPKMLQTAWVAGGERRGRGEDDPKDSARIPKATITLASGESVEGSLVRIDDFLVTVELVDGTQRTFRRNGDVPKVVIQDPMKTHTDMLSQYTDKDIHDVTAYLVTLK